MSIYMTPERLDVTSAPGVEKDLLALLETGEVVSLTCDFSKTEYISSAGLRIMLVITKKMKAEGREFILCSLQPMIKEVFELSGLDTFMDIRD